MIPDKGALDPKIVEAVARAISLECARQFKATPAPGLENNPTCWTARGGTLDLVQIAQAAILTYLSAVGDAPKWVPFDAPICINCGHVGDLDTLSKGAISCCPERETFLLDQIHAKGPGRLSDFLSGDVGDGWRDIESAPKDGTEILLWSAVGDRGNGGATVGHWTTDEELKIDIGDCGGECRCREYEYLEPSWMSYDGGFTAEYPPTHWQPLPLPPGAPKPRTIKWERNGVPTERPMPNCEVTDGTTKPPRRSAEEVAREVYETKNDDDLLPLELMIAAIEADRREGGA